MNEFMIQRVPPSANPSLVEERIRRLGNKSKANPNILTT